MISGYEEQQMIYPPELYDKGYDEMHDEVNHPRHYTQGNIETIDFIEDQKFGYLAGNIIKYICRYRWKGNAVQDLRKAQFYLNRLIMQEEQYAADVQKPLRDGHGSHRSSVLHDAKGHPG